MSFRRRLCLGLQTGGVIVSGIAAAEDIAINAAGAYAPRIDYIGDLPGVPIKGGVSFAAEMEAIYDSNFFLDEEDEQDEMTLVFSPVISYHSDPEGGALLSFDLSYTPQFRTYLENSDLTDLLHSVTGNVVLSAPRTSVIAYGEYREVAGTDRLAQDFVEGSLLRLGIYGTYQLAPRTRIGVDLSYSKSEYDTGQFGGSFYEAEISANWDCTERLSFGPLLRYTRPQARSVESRDTWAFLVQANYVIDERLKFTASLGLERSEYGSGSGAEWDVTGDINATYFITERLRWSLSLRHATIPAPSTEGYYAQDLTIVTALTRELNYGEISLEVHWSTASYEAAGGAPEDGRKDDRFTTAEIIYRRPILSERMSFEGSLAYSMGSGGIDYDRWIASVGVTYNF